MRLMILMAVFVSACASGECPPGLKPSELGACGWPVAGKGGSGSSAGAAGKLSLPAQVSQPASGGAGSRAGSGGHVATGEAGSGGADAGGVVVWHDAGSDAETEEDHSAAGSGGKAVEPTGGSGGQQPDAGTSSTPDAGSSEPEAGGMQAPMPPVPRCGDGHVDPGEACDGDCPSICDDSDPCTKDVLTGKASTCDAICSHVPIAQATSGDGCCPMGATYATDKDCPQSCGDGVVDGVELCDGNCPSACDDGDPCTTDSLTGSAAMCNAKCVSTPITMSKPGDKCCPAGANAANDSDCQPVCGNGVKEGNELCDGDCPTSCPASTGCMTSALSGSAATCDATCKTTTITGKANGDGCCPANANSNTDSDCAPPPGCSRESATNLIANPGFATGTTGWDISGSYGTVGWSSGDYESCSISGSALLTANNQIGRIISQCVPASAGTYYFSVRIKSGGNGGQVTCAVAAYQIAGCQGQGKAEAEADWLNVDWGPTTSTSFTVDPSFQSLLVACYINAKGVEEDATAEVDQVYLGTTDAAF